MPILLCQFRDAETLKAHLSYQLAYLSHVIYIYFKALFILSKATKDN